MHFLPNRSVTEEDISEFLEITSSLIDHHEIQYYFFYLKLAHARQPMQAFEVRNKFPLHMIDVFGNSSQRYSPLYSSCFSVV